MILRLSKAAMVLAMALFASLVSVNNMTDYASNFAFVQHVFLMDTTFPGNALMYRAITSPTLHHLGYIVIIALETVTAALCWIGGVRMLRALRVSHPLFQRAKSTAIAGLTLGFLTWQVGFISVGGEWFAMWMSQEWNGVSAAFRFFMSFIVVLIYVAMPYDQLQAEAP
ncbi:MAG: DUF2165 domain-containing protein [Burkholderiaceae bacterium]|nr:DUF2165 domain-containing protein [Burkholderiaceae bacterium]